MLFSDRIIVKVKYQAWLNQEREGDKYFIADCPETFLVFLQTMGWLNEEKILEETRKDRRCRIKASMGSIYGSTVKGGEI